MSTPRPPAWSPDSLARWAGGQWIGPPRGDVRGVSSDTRTLQPGNLFVALRGERFDGHAFVPEALRRGAAAALVARDAATGHDAAAPLLVVEDTRAGLTGLAAGHGATLTGQRLAVTGSVGKTTVKELLADALAATGTTFRSPGNWNNDLGLPLSLLGMNSACAFGVFELGMNHPGEIAGLTDLLRPGAGVMTPIGPVHLEAFADEAGIALEKSALLARLPADGWAVVSADSPWFGLFRQTAPCRLVTTTSGPGGGGDYRAARRADGTFSVREAESGETAVFEPALPGRYFVENALLAIAAARSLRVSWVALQAVVSAYRPQPMRWECREVAGVQVINDAYNANPLSMREAMRAFAEIPVAGRRWLALGGMRELGPAADELHRALGREVAAGAWAGLFACGAAGPLIAEGARVAGMDPGRIRCCPDAEDAAGRLCQATRPGDAVLIKASRGEHLEQIITTWNKGADGAPASPCGVSESTD